MYLKFFVVQCDFRLFLVLLEHCCPSAVTQIGYDFSKALRTNVHLFHESHPWVSTHVEFMATRSLLSRAFFMAKAMLVSFLLCCLASFSGLPGSEYILRVCSSAGSLHPAFASDSRIHVLFIRCPCFWVHMHDCVRKHRFLLLDKKVLCISFCFVN